MKNKFLIGVLFLVLFLALVPAFLMVFNIERESDEDPNSQILSDLRNVKLSLEDSGSNYGDPESYQNSRNWLALRTRLPECSSSLLEEDGLSPAYQLNSRDENWAVWAPLCNKEEAVYHCLDSEGFSGNREDLTDPEAIRCEEVFGSDSEEFEDEVSEDEKTEEKIEDYPETSEEKIILGFVGDIMLDRGVLLHAEKNEDPTFPFLKVKERLQKPDILFGNLESMISDKGSDQGGAYSFRAPPKMMEGLILADFDLLSVANNHSFDWGGEAFADTVERLSQAGIKAVGGGLEAYSPVFVESGTQTIAYLGYTTLGAPGWVPTEAVPGVAMYDDERMKQGIAEAEQAEADIIVVSIHYGIEYQPIQSPEQERISRLAIDEGADLVIGHHPHVIQPVEEYEGGIIAYSLGNFIFDQGFSEETMEGLLLEVEIMDGEIVGWEKEVIPMNQQFQPVPES